MVDATWVVKDAVGLVRDKFRGLLAGFLILGFVFVGVRMDALADLKDAALIALGFYFGARSNGNGTK